MSISQRMLRELDRKYTGEQIIRGYDNFIHSYKIKHYNRLVTTLDKQSWFDTRNSVLERFVKRYYLKSYKVDAE